MQTVFHKADSRGHANHGWLDAYHSFSFANWFDPNRIQFGMLRVLNDDTIAAGMGFGTHPHDNMEIITIPLEGDLAHKDSMGNAATIRNGEIQVMSAGTGIQHSEFNPNHNSQTKLLQIWIFPKIRDVAPRYQQLSLENFNKINELHRILSPYADEDGVWIYQDAWFHKGKFEANQKIDYSINKPKNGLYVFVLSGCLNINNQELNSRDGFGIWDFENIEISVIKESEFLLIEVPMEQ